MAIGIGIPFLVAGPLCEPQLTSDLLEMDECLLQTTLSKSPDLQNLKT